MVCLRYQNTFPAGLLRANIAEMAVPTIRKTFHSERTGKFTESVIREMTRLAIQSGAVNLAHGFPPISRLRSI